MRRTVATLLVVASPLLLANPVEAGDGRRIPGGATPAVASAGPAVAAPSPATLPSPAALASAVAPPVALPAPAVTAPVPATPSPVRHAVRPVRSRARTAVTAAGDNAYSARLQAELCAARQIFCGLDRNGRYPAR